MSGKKKVRLVHTSDLHIGDRSGHPMADCALRAVVEATPRLGGDVLLLAGDIFDNARVSDDVVEEFVDEIHRLASCETVILPGNHDLYNEGSVYLRPAFRDKPDNLHIITQAEGETITFPELTLKVWGRAMPSHTPDFHPLEGMPENGEDLWLVALAHGHFHFDDDLDRRSSPIYPAEVANAPCDYLALGHWDRHADVSQGQVTAVYSGTARGWTQSNPLGSVTIVDLDPEAGVSWQQVALTSGVSMSERGA